jgi:hypothetical protein
MQAPQAGFSSPVGSGPASKEEEIRLLKDEAQDLIKKVKEIEQRIGTIERGG